MVVWLLGRVNLFVFHIGRDSLFPSYYNFRTWSRGNYQMKTRKTLDIKLIFSFKPYHGCLQSMLLNFFFQIFNFAKVSNSAL
jgi:hypothetical protein